MLRLIPLILKSAARNRVRTVLTLLGVMIAVGIFSFLAAVELSMKGTIDQVAQSTLLVMAEKDQW